MPRPVSHPGAPRRQQGRAPFDLYTADAGREGRSPARELHARRPRRAAPARRSARRAPRAARAAAAFPRSPISCCCRRSTARSRCSRIWRPDLLVHPERLYRDAAWSSRASFRTFGESAAGDRYPNTSTTICDVLRAADRRTARSRLSMVLEQSAIPIELQERKHGVRVAIIPDLELQRNAHVRPRRRAQMPGDTLRARFPTQVEDRPGREHPRLVNLQPARRRPAPAARRAAPDSLSRRIQLLRARHARTSCGSSSSARAAWRCTSRGDIPGPRARVLGDPQISGLNA